MYKREIFWIGYRQAFGKVNQKTVESLNVSPTDAIDDLVNLGFGKVVLVLQGSTSGPGARFLSNFYHNLSGNFCGVHFFTLPRQILATLFMHNQAGFHRVSDVPARRNIFQILGPIIQLVAVDVINLITLRSWPDKRLGNQAVRRAMGRLAVFLGICEGDSEIAVIGNVVFDYTDETDAAQVTHFVVGKVGNGTPNFRQFISSIHSDILSRNPYKTEVLCQNLS